MKKRSNRLYENLISNIAKQVKKAILESDYAYATIESNKQEVIDQALRDLDNLEKAHMLHNKPGKFNRNRKYRNVEGTLYVPGGSHGDPYIVLDGHKINYYDAEDEMWYQYELACDELDMEPDEELFIDWANGQNPDLIKTWLESLIEK